MILFLMAQAAQTIDPKGPVGTWDDAPKFELTGDEELRDIHGYHAIEIPMFVWYILGFLLIFTIAYIVYHQVLARRKVKELTNYDIALDELSKLNVNEESKTLYLQYSEIIKRYIERELSIPVLDKTVEELKIVLADHPMLGTTQFNFLIKAFARGDLAKFAQKELSPEEKAGDIKFAIDMINLIDITISKAKADEASKLQQKEDSGEEEKEELAV